jgi:hypothetical protein
LLNHLDTRYEAELDYKVIDCKVAVTSLNLLFSVIMIYLIITNLIY